MVISVSQAATRALADAVVDLCDVGAGANPLLRIYGGTVPTSAQEEVSADPPTGASELVEFTLNGTAAFTAAANGGASSVGGSATDSRTEIVGTESTAQLSATAGATGTAAFFRIVDKDGDCVMQGTITATGGGGDMELVTTSIVSGQTVNLTDGIFRGLAAQGAT